MARECKVDENDVARSFIAGAWLNDELARMKVVLYYSVIKQGSDAVTEVMKLWYRVKFISYMTYAYSQIQVDEKGTTYE